MIINQLIALILPSFIGVKAYDKVFGEEQGKKKNIIKFAKCMLLTNLIMYAIVIYIFRKPEFIFTNQFTVKYLILSLVIVHIILVIEKLIKDNIDIQIKVEKDENQN